MSPNFCLKSADVGSILAKHGKIYITYTNSYSSGIGLQGMQIGIYDFLWYIIGNNKYATQNNSSVGSSTQKWTRPPGISGSGVNVNLTNTGRVPTLSPPPPTNTSTPTPARPSGGLPGDGNNEGLVDGEDFIIWLNHFGQSVSGANNGDLYNNSIVNIDDYIIWGGNY